MDEITKIRNNFKKFCLVGISKLPIIPSRLKPNYQFIAYSELKNFTTIKNKKILIVGVGSGKEVSYMYRDGAKKICGIDINPRINTSDFDKKRVEIVKSKAEEMPFKDESFDIVYSIATLEHVEDPIRVVSECRRVLKKQGLFYLAFGPLWYSFHGFHYKKEYPEINEPWIHLIKTKKEILKDKKIGQNKEYTNHLERIFESNSYNRLPAAIYYKAISKILNKDLPLEINISVDKNKFDNLPNSHKKKLRKYNLKDLLTRRVTIISIKL